MWAPDYAQVAELKEYVGIPTDDEVDDGELAGKIAAASRAVDKSARRQFGKVDALELRTYTAQARAGGMYVVIDDLMDVTDMTVSVAGVAVTPARLWPSNAPQMGRPYERLWLPGATINCDPDAVEISALWGWAAVPDTIKEATLLQASRLTSRRNSPFGVAGSPDLGSELRLLAKVDPDVAVMVRSYTRRAAVA